MPIQFVCVRFTSAVCDVSGYGVRYCMHDVQWASSGLFFDPIQSLPGVTMGILDKIDDRPMSLSDRVYASVRSAIVASKFPAGQRLTEEGLAKELGVSKTPVREAMLRLAYVGLVQSGATGGGRVMTPTRQALSDAYDVREGLEAQVARIAALKGVRSMLEETRSYATSSKEVAERGDREGFRQNDERFHMSLCEATQNDVLMRLVRDSYDLTSALRARDAPGTPYSVECADQHLEIMDAVDAGDDVAADVAMRTHLSKVRQRMMDAYDRHGIN